MKHEKFVALVTKAIVALELQGRPSVDSEGRCLYKSEYGACIVGHMMRPIVRGKADATEEELSSSISALYSRGFPWAMQFNLNQISFMTELQCMHDSVAINGSNFTLAIQRMKTKLLRYEKDYQCQAKQIP